jgi:hypothetical protein
VGISSPLERLWARHVSRPAEVVVEGEAALAALSDQERADVVAVLVRAVDAVLAHFGVSGAGRDALVAGHRRAWWHERSRSLAGLRDELRRRGIDSDLVERRLAHRREVLAFPEPPALAAEQERLLEREGERLVASRAATGELAVVLDELATAESEPSPALVELVSAHVLGALRAAAFGREADALAVLGLCRAYARLVTARWLPFLLGEEVVATALLFGYRQRAPAVTDLALALAPLQVTTAGLAFQLARAHAGRRERGPFLHFLECACVLDRDSFELDDPELAPYRTDSDYRRILAAHPPTVEVFEPDYDDGS